MSSRELGRYLQSQPLGDSDGVCVCVWVGGCVCVPQPLGDSDGVCVCARARVWVCVEWVCP